MPCLTIASPNTERPVTITHGTNRLVSPGEVGKRAAMILAGEATFPTGRPPLWDGHAGQRIADVVVASID